MKNIGKYGAGRIAILCALICALFCALFCACGGKKEPKNAVLILGTDSLTINDVRALVPDGADDQSRIRQACIRYSLSGTRLLDSAGIKLAERLSLLSGAVWSPEAASLLLRAGRKLDSGTSNARDVKAIDAFLDSLAQITNNCCGVTTILGSSDSAQLHAMNTGDKKFQRSLFSAVFAISRDAASTLINFVKETSPAGGKSAGSLIRGLLAAPRADRNAHMVEGPRRGRELPENPALALNFRPQSLIRDSISLHVPYLKGFYNNQLKTDELTAGVVWVVFHVNPDGRVAWARIKSSEIDSKPFLTRVENYLPNIRFSAIPDSVGTMTFEFPFEFKPEK